MNILRRLPFVLFMLVVIGCAGVYSESHIGTTNVDAQRAVGYSIRLLIEGELQRAITSLFLTAGGWRFYSSMVMLALAVGYVEATRGTIPAALTFFAIHLATLLILAIVVLFCHALIPTLHSQLILHTQDVGPSAGYYGCLGLAVAGLKPSIRGGVITFILIVLSVRAAHSLTYLPVNAQAFEADLAHLIAFPLGITSSCLYRPVKCNILDEVVKPR